MEIQPKTIENNLIPVDLNVTETSSETFGAGTGTPSTNTTPPANIGTDWTDVSGVDKPEDNATVGADWTSNLDNIPEIRGWSHDLIFSAVDADTVAWTAGSIYLPSGATYSIDAGNTGNMAAKTYIYFNKAVSQTVLQTSTTASNAVGTNKILIAVAENSTNDAIHVIEYDASVVPASDGWHTGGNNTPTEEISPAGYLHVLCSNLPSDEDYWTSINSGYSQTPFNTTPNGFSVKIKLKILQADTGYSGSGISLLFNNNGNGNYGGGIIFWSDGVTLWDDNLSVDYPFDTTDDYHIYEMVVRTDTGKIRYYIDNVFIQENDAETDSNPFGWGTEAVTLAVNGSSVDEEISVDYIYTATNDNSYDPSNGNSDATFQVFGGIGGILVGKNNFAPNSITANEIAANTITAGNIASGTITTNEIAANAITAGQIDVGNLAAIVADMGTITAGNITLDTSGYIRGGQTAYNTGTGFFLGYSTSAYKFSIGSTTNYFLWDGTDLTLTGKINKLAGDILYQSADTEADTTEGSYTKYKEITVYQPGTYRIKFDLNAQNVGQTIYGRIYVNDVAVGTEQSRAITSYATFSEDISGIVSSDKIQFYAHVANSGSNPGKYKNFRLYVSQFDNSTVDLDT